MPERVVERHAIDPGFFRSSFDPSKLPGFVARRPVTWRLLRGLHAITQRDFGYGAVLAPGDPILRLAARTHAQATAGLLQALSGSLGPFPFGDAQVELEAAPPRGVDAPRVVEAQYFALLANDRESSTRIATASDEALQTSAVQVDAFWWTWRRALGALTVAPARALADTLDALALTDLATIAHRGAVDRARQVMQVFEAILRDEAELAADRLVEELEAHRAWSTQDRNEHLPQALVSTAGSAALAVARARGLELNVRSDYLVELA